MATREGVEVDFDKEELETWLQDQSHELLAALTCRSVLRVLPALERGFGQGKSNASIADSAVLPVFRALIASAVVAMEPAEQSIAGSYDVHSSSKSAARSAARMAAKAADHASPQAVQTTYAASAAATAAAASTAIEAAAYAVEAIDVTASYAPHAILRDRDKSSKGLSGRELMGMPLWPDEWGEPQVIADLRLGLFGRLHRENVEWAVWIGWYDDRLKGKPVEAPLFRAWALLPDGLWAIGPEAVNPVLRVLNEAWRDGGPDALQEAFRHNYARYAPEAKMPDLLINGKGPPSSDTRHEVRPSADRAETVRDLLGRASIAFQLATHLNRIWSQQTERRTAIEAAASDEAAYIAHIDAPWGGGKTTFANFVARMLNPDAFGIARDHALFAGLPFDKGKWAGGFGERKWIPIVYNAWRHQHVSPPWWNFYEAIHRQATAAMGRGWYWFYRLDEFVWRLFTPNLFRTLLVLVLTGAVAYGLYSIPLFNALLTADSGKTNDFGKLLVLALTGGGGLVLINSLRTGFRALVESVGSSADAATLGEADPLPRFRNHFRRLIERINRPLLVIIDDLDRCEPDYVVELVRGLMTIFNSSRVVFVLLGDKRWIEQSFAIVHEKMKPAHAGDEVPFGARFAEKAIQLSFVLPEPGETERSGYVRALLIGEEPSAAQPVEVAEQDLDALRDFAAHAEASLEPAVSIEEQNAQLASLRATAETRFAGSGDTVRDAAQRVLYSKAALRAGTSEATEHETRHALLTIVDRLPVNPRRIKRILNMVSIYQLTALELQQVALGSHEWKQLVLWIILMSERAEAWKEICATGTVAEPDDLIRALLGDVMFDDETVRIDADALKWLRRLTPVV